MDPQMVPKLVQTNSTNKNWFRDQLFGIFQILLGSRTSQNKPRWPPKAFQESKHSDIMRFWKHSFHSCVYGFLEHQTTQKTPKTAQKPPKMAAESCRQPPRAFQKQDQCLDQLFNKKMTPKLLQKLSNKLQTLVQKHVQTKRKTSQFRAPKWTPKWL